MQEQKNNILKVPAECWSRVCGYFRPVLQWNKGKQEEFKNRKEYKIPEDLYYDR